MATISSPSPILQKPGNKDGNSTSNQGVALSYLDAYQRSYLTEQDSPRTILAEKIP